VLRVLDFIPEMPELSVAVDTAKDGQIETESASWKTRVWEKVW